MGKRYLILVVILAGCVDAKPKTTETSGRGASATQSIPATPAESSGASSSLLPPENVNERVAVLKQAGFTLEHKYDDFVQYSRGTLIVDLDLDDDGIHVTPIDRSQTELTDDTLKSVYDVYEMLGLQVRDLTYHVTPANGKGGPELHRTRIRGWNVEKRCWPKGMFVAFSAEKSTE